jgi:hypothetical protein
VVPGSGGDSIDLALQRYQQGDVLPDVRSLAAATPRRVLLAVLWERLVQAAQALPQIIGRRPPATRGDRSPWERTPNGAVIISQTCDVVRSHRERRTIQAAKLVQLAGDMQREATDGRRPRYVAVPNTGADWFADLEVIGTIDKRVLVRLSRRLGVVNDEQVRRFATAVGRNFSRFPFPDEVSDQLKPLVDDVRRKYGSGHSPLGQILQQVTELRLGVPAWRLCRSGPWGRFAMWTWMRCWQRPSRWSRRT